MSLLPSITEIIFALGAGDDVVEVTFECDFPPEARSRRIVSALTAGLTPGQIDAEVRSRLAAGEDLYLLDADALGELNRSSPRICARCVRWTSAMSTGAGVPGLPGGGAHRRPGHAERGAGLHLHGGPARGSRVGGAPVGRCVGGPA